MKKIKQEGMQGFMDTRGLEDWLVGLAAERGYGPAIKEGKSAGSGTGKCSLP